MLAPRAHACKVAEPPAGDHRNPGERNAPATSHTGLEVFTQAELHALVSSFIRELEDSDYLRASNMPRSESSPVMPERGSPFGQNMVARLNSEQADSIHTHGETGTSSMPPPTTSPAFL